MIKVVVSAHGKLAQELVNSAEVVAGKQSNLYVVKKSDNDSLVQMQNRINNLLKSINDEDGILILTDMIGGSPCSASASTCRSLNTEILSGVNLPMVLSAIFLSKNTKTVSDLAEKVLLDGQKSIINVKKMLFNKIK
ncbi:PTS mannose transporter subunit IIAB [Endomicrobiia bacterium]|uniref:PTS mannose/fructose/N-acetylgalactosamine-specific component IIA n=1 Tax=Endomicrobium trichonymphae TaxID=1408204 RepID=B1H085_ENDTX|nr:PTS mannose/fructose/N-acetylgalactosamine- specific component IIA [Candidatus Endomicrobium trichonymphae]GHT03997.1 PTS mannose transporter subunit IIAB [Endomicrobiia bacterium]BAG13917.1 PTS mannose/fructose/N-acetylgalactosamine-specific component IIA [Candidatus Endomicrobium trichonymphae]BAV59005.1 PTS mannose/fructose/N-acetylgalactosamine-specific component IIA [Candidatus Endomicrobium trichonymphae]GHT09159.1 PTS mannose transporter subunit IIAB [Endomicrobiia bacterium]GHT11049